MQPRLATSSYEHDRKLALLGWLSCRILIDRCSVSPVSQPLHIYMPSVRCFQISIPFRTEKLNEGGV
ncbi:hypothetical protein LSTR_LSTR010600 [Laodelphax striatellus]|uniref:Uncharacterized protein n=1 Tax=Laodelphax striatellus TaxID=195883 RepID=A0A482XJK8_LAOST|nr:hypothetical protein LSTR_LSTR010600 [Laodelphax striatellus]